MDENLEAILSAKAEWDSLQPLSPEHDRRLWQKLRLEWNYHSNHIEGNTLTYGETELLLIHGQTHGNHTLREYEEMKAHDVGIAHLRELAADTSRLISEADIRNLNKIILKEPFWKSAQTAEGGPTRKQVIPGEYKTTPNNVITATGELFEFAPPADVPSRMSALVAWLGRKLSADAPPILSILARLHHEFVLIHPFDDGNGRVARMLVNYVLMRQGYPPIIVPTGRKTEYLAALRLADAGEILGLVSFLGTCIIRSLELGIKAAKRENLDEPGDVEKEIELFKRSQEHHKDKVKPRSPESIRWLYENGFRALISRLIDKMRVFDDLFVRSSVSAEPRGESDPTAVLTTFEEHLAKGFQIYQQFTIRFHYEGYRGEADAPFNVKASLSLALGDFEYKWTARSKLLTRKLYSEPVMSDEIDRIVEALQKEVLKTIRASGKPS